MVRLSFSIRIPALLMLALVFLNGASAQGKAPDALSEAESRMLEALMARFQPLPSVEHIWTGAFQAASGKSSAIKAQVDSLERSDLDEAEVLVRVGALSLIHI